MMPSQPHISRDSAAERELDALSSRLAVRPHEFDFFQAVRRLEAAYARLGYPRIGSSQNRAGDPLHFGQRPFLEFAPRTIDAWNEAGLPGCTFPGKPSLLVFFFGLFGPNGALPLHMTEFALRRQRRGDHALVDFANVLHHRLLCFYYRAWASVRITADLDRPEQQRFAGFVGSLFGAGTVAAQQRTPAFELQAPASAREAVPGSAARRWRTSDWPKLYYAGHLASQARNADGLEALLRDYFGLPITVQEFVGRWWPLPAGAPCELGASAETGRLGRSAILGERVWDCQMAFRLRVGPLSRDDFKRLLPGQRSCTRLKQWVLEYCGAEFSWDLQLLLREKAAPPTVLGRLGQLGRTAFLWSDREARMGQELTFRPVGAAELLAA